VKKVQQQEAATFSETLHKEEIAAEHPWILCSEFSLVTTQ